MGLVHVCAVYSLFKPLDCIHAIPKCQRFPTDVSQGYMRSGCSQHGISHYDILFREWQNEITVAVENDANSHHCWGYISRNFKKSVISFINNTRPTHSSQVKIETYDQYGLVRREAQHLVGHCDATTVGYYRTTVWRVMLSQDTASSARHHHWRHPATLLIFGMTGGHLVAETDLGWQ